MRLRLPGVLLALLATGCSGATAMPASQSSAEHGQAVLETQCTVCHDLGGLEVFADFWDEPEWRSLMDTMVSYGATLTPTQYEVLAAYLAGEY